MRALLAFCLAALLCSPVAAEELLRNLRLVDVETGTVSEAVDLRLRDGRIAEIGADLDARGATVRAMGGGFAIPGLWDSHVHVFSSPEEHLTALPLHLLHGVTSVRDMGGLLPVSDMQAIADATEAGTMLGPRIRLSGAWVDAPPGSWPGMFLAAAPEEARDVVGRIASGPWSAVKAYSMLSAETFRALAEAAEAAGLPLVGHVPETVTLREALAAGQSVVEHWGRVTRACASAEAEMVAAMSDLLAAGAPMEDLLGQMATQNARVIATWEAALCEAVLAEMAGQKVHVVPTFVVAGFYLGLKPEADAPRMRMLPRDVRAAWEAPDFRLEAMTDELRALAETSIALDRRTFRMAHRAGVPILAGTDASFANPFIFHGASLIDELDLYVEAGLSPREALTTATVAPARLFGGAGASGSLARGDPADIVVLSENPLEDIGALRDIRAVSVSGRVLDRAALDALAARLIRRGAP